MSIAIPADEWLKVLREEYMQGFIKSGGAAVKFAVPPNDGEQTRLMQEMSRFAQEDGYLFVSVDAATTKVHMMDKVFHSVAKAVAWESLAYTFLRSALSSYYVPVGREDFRLTKLAALNDLDPAEMRRIINNRLGDRLFKDYAMIQEFRIAMLRLCGAEFDPEDARTLAEDVKNWLRGELPRITAALRSAFIFQKIGRHNARRMLASLSHWLRVTGKAGLVLALDISRFLDAKRPADGSLYYSRAALLDGYEVLRQFIDDTDELEHCLVVVLAPPSFLTADESRGAAAYDALRLRIWDEVSDKQRPNPLSPLIRLGRQ